MEIDNNDEWTKSKKLTHRWLKNKEMCWNSTIETMNIQSKYIFQWLLAIVEVRDDKETIEQESKDRWKTREDSMNVRVIGAIVEDWTSTVEQQLNEFHQQS